MMKLLCLLSIAIFVIATEVTAKSTFSLDWDRDRERQASEYCSPDLDKLIKQAADKGRAEPNPGGPVLRAVTGPHGRVEFVESQIENKHIGKGSRITRQMEEKAKTMGKKGDIAGQVLIANLGGPGNKPWNIMPQHANKAYREQWSQFEEDVASFAKKGNSVKYVVLLEYPDEGATSPDSVWYAYAYKDSTGDHCSSGTIYSPGKKINWGFSF